MVIEVWKTYKFRLYEHDRNKYLHQAIDVAGLIWNHAVSLQRTHYRLTGKYIQKYTLQKHLLKLRRTRRFAHWKLLGSQAVQEIAERLDKAYLRFFDYVKLKDKRGKRRVGRPSFKKVKQFKSFVLKQAGWKLLGDNKVRIQKHDYKFSLSRPIKGTVKRVIIKRSKLGKLYICFSVVENITTPDQPIKASTSRIGGFDFGLKTFLTDSNGNQYISPQFFKRSQNEIARLNRLLACKKRGSNNWKRANRRLAQAHEKIANQRRNYFFSLAHQLCDQYDFLFFETLNLEGMKKLWGRKVSDLAFGEYLKIQEWVCKVRGKLFGQIDQWEPTTKPCAGCGKIHDLSLSDRVMNCDGCGLVIDRDHNAAINISAVGASTAGLGDVRQALLSAVSA